MNCMKLVAYAKNQINLPDGKYDGNIVKDGYPFCSILISRDENVHFAFETLGNLYLFKGMCTVKVVKNRAAIYIEE